MTPFHSITTIDNKRMGLTIMLFLVVSNDLTVGLMGCYISQPKTTSFYDP